MKIRFIIPAILAAALASCTRGGHDASVHIERLDSTLAHFSELPADRQQAITDSLEPELQAMFAVMGRPYSGTPAELRQWAQGDVVRWFQPPVDSVYPDINLLRLELGHILKKAEAENLHLPEMRYATVVWGISRPVVRVDSVMLIALNHYLGVDFEGYSNWEAYRRALKNTDQLYYDLAAALVATEYPFDGGDSPTLLSWMLYEGVLAHARGRLVLDSTAAGVLGLSQEQFDFFEDNSKQMWQELAARRMLYDTDPSLIDRMIASAPTSPLLGGTAPGRAGRYIGYAIVRAYLKKHPDTSLRQLLSPDFYLSQKTLIESGYSG